MVRQQYINAPVVIPPKRAVIEATEYRDESITMSTTGTRYTMRLMWKLRLECGHAVTRPRGRGTAKFAGCHECLKVPS